MQQLALEAYRYVTRDYHIEQKSSDSTTETIQGPALPLESVDDVHGSDSLPLGMLSVGDGVADDILQEHLQDTSGLFIDETAYPLDSSSSCQSSNSRLGDALNVVPQDLAMPLGAAFSKTLASFATASHGCCQEQFLS